MTEGKVIRFLANTTKPPEALDLRDLLRLHREAHGRCGCAWVAELHDLVAAAPDLMDSIQDTVKSWERDGDSSYTSGIVLLNAAYDLLNRFTREDL
jgi:hypothetical protein